MTGLVPLLRRRLPAALLLIAAGLPIAYAALDLFAKQKAADELLDAGQAFHAEAPVVEADAVHLRWTIAAGYYLYRARLKVEADGALAPGMYFARLVSGTRSASLKCLVLR